MKKIKANTLEELRKELTERMIFFNSQGEIFEAWLKGYENGTLCRDLYDSISAFIFGLRACGAITDNQENNILNDLVNNYIV